MHHQDPPPSSHLPTTTITQFHNNTLSHCNTANITITQPPTIPLNLTPNTAHLRDGVLIITWRFAEKPSNGDVGRSAGVLRVTHHLYVDPAPLKQALCHPHILMALGMVGKVSERSSENAQSLTAKRKGGELIT